MSIEIIHKNCSLFQGLDSNLDTKTQCGSQRLNWCVFCNFNSVQVPNVSSHFSIANNYSLTFHILNWKMHLIQQISWQKIKSKNIFMRFELTPTEHQSVVTRTKSPVLGKHWWVRLNGEVQTCSCKKCPGCHFAAQCPIYCWQLNGAHSPTKIMIMNMNLTFPL